MTIETLLTTGVWVAPASMWVHVFCVAPGSGGGVNVSSKGGGGGGATAADDIFVIKDTSYNVTIPAGSTPGNDASDTIFGANLVVADGAYAAGNGSTLGGTKGLASASIGAIKHDGADGGIGRIPNNTGGGAGSSGGSSANGNPGASGLAGGTGGAAVADGGAGGNGGVNAAGSSGGGYGGGGGGGGGANPSANGDPGKIVLTYTIPSGGGNLVGQSALVSGGILVGRQLVS